MTGVAFLLPGYRATLTSGAVAAGALLQFYESGTTTPTPAYTSSALSNPLANPVAADSAGLFPPIFLDPSVTYRARLTDSGGNLIEDIDPVNGQQTPAGGSITGAMLAVGAALANIGYTPVNRAGDTATNLALAFSAPSVNSAGYLGAPINEQDVSYTLALSDAGGMVRCYSPSAVTYTIPLISDVPFPDGTVILIRNYGAGVVTLTRTTGVILSLAGSGTSKDIAIAQYGAVSLIQEGPNYWYVSGVGAT